MGLDFVRVRDIIGAYLVHLRLHFGKPLGDTLDEKPNGISGHVPVGQVGLVFFARTTGMGRVWDKNARKNIKQRIIGDRGMRKEGRE